MANEAKDLIHLQLKDGLVVIETRPDLAPKHVEQIKKLVTDGEYKSVAYGNIVGYLIEAIKELSAKVENLEQ